MAHTSVSSTVLQSPDHFNQKDFKIKMEGFTVTLLSAAAYISPFLVSFPLASFIQIIGLSVLTTTSLGLIDSQLAYQQCKQFFIVRYHSLQQHPALIAAADGIQKTWTWGLYAGVILAIAARATQLVALSALSLTPIALLMAIGAAVHIHLTSKSKEAESKQNQNIEEASQRDRNWSQVAPDQRSAYRGVDGRESMMGSLFFYGTIILTISLIALRIFLTVAACLC